MTTGTNRPLAIWLLSCCAMVFVMALIGAITRLTESGLSITDWNPILGAIPPLNDADWNKAFASYQQIPQYQILNLGMSLDAFKHIFFWEWLHRLWGRLIGLVFLVPLIVFAMRRQLHRPLLIKLSAIFVLIALQGFIGWYMVQSGLSVRTSVSPYRLALHLGFALVIYAIMLWVACGLMGQKLAAAALPSARNLSRQGWLTLGLLVVTMVWGAFVAGLHAGEAYNTWPLMDGEILPAAATTLLPTWRNIFENLAFVQFIHRWLAPVTMLAIIIWAWRGARSTLAPDKKWFIALGVMSIVQVALGLSTLLTHANIVLATLHQAGAITLLSLMLVNLQRLSRSVKSI